MLAQSVASKALAKRLLTRCTHPRSRSLLPSNSTPAHRCSPLCHHAQHGAAFSSVASSSSAHSAPFAAPSSGAAASFALSSPSAASASSSSSFFSASLAGISALVVATGAAIIAITTITEAEAEPATSQLDTASTTTTPTTHNTPALPLILPTINPASPTPYSSRPAAASPSPATLLSSLAPPRPQLPNPGLEPDKQVVLIPVLQAGEGGGHGMLNVRTSLGHRHAMEGMIDTQWNVVGEYKYIHAPWVVKPSFRSIAQQGDDVSLEVDYRGKEFVAQATLGSNAQEYVLSYLRSVHRNLALGVQLHAILGQVAFLNVTGRYNSHEGDLFSVSRKNQMLLFSYHRTVLDQPASPSSPPSNVALAAELRVHEASKQSEWAVGLQYARPLFKYALCVASDWRVGVVLEQNIGPTMMLNLAGEMKYDGSGESKFGIGVSIG